MFNPIESFTLQSMSDKLGDDQARRYCAPLCFYMLLRALKILDPAVMPSQFCAELDRQSLSTTNADWSRPALSKLIRNKYQVDIISWQIGGESNIVLMKQAGYLDNDREVDFFESHIKGHSIEQIVRSGYPVIATMNANFDHGGNNIHAVILATWSDAVVRVIDPDARNRNTEYRPERLLPFIRNNGGGTIILPRP